MLADESSWLNLVKPGARTLNGSIDADGPKYVGGVIKTYYAASGGSVWLTADSITGTGAIYEQCNHSNRTNCGQELWARLWWPSSAVRFPGRYPAAVRGAGGGLRGLGACFAGA